MPVACPLHFIEADAANNTRRRWGLSLITKASDSGRARQRRRQPE